MAELSTVGVGGRAVEWSGRAREGREPREPLCACACTGLWERTRRTAEREAWAGGQRLHLGLSTSGVLAVALVARGSRSLAKLRVSLSEAGSAARRTEPQRKQEKY